MADQFRSPAQPRLSEQEFIVLTAMLFATIAFSIDAMLPALTEMGADLSPAEPERATLVIGLFVLGMGFGTFFAGPMSDAWGRKPLIIGGYGLFALGALISAFSGSLEWVLAGRFLQGVAVAGPRIAAIAMVRDLYSGDRMASITSFVMMVFVLVPAVAPLIGQLIMDAFGWHAIFLSFILFAAGVGGWFALRQPETLPSQRRRALSFQKIFDALMECLSNRIFRFSVIALTMSFATLYAFISAVQPIYAETYGAADSFPYWMAGTALMALPSNFTNGRIVGRYGMRFLVKTGFITQAMLTVLALLLWWSGALTLVWFFVWATAFIFCLGFIIGNLTALSLEPMGHIAGMAASMNGAISTIAASVLAIPVGLAFNGTPTPLLIGNLVFALTGYLLLRRLGPRAMVQPV